MDKRKIKVRQDAIGGWWVDDGQEVLGPFEGNVIKLSEDVIIPLTGEDQARRIAGALSRAMREAGVELEPVATLDGQLADLARRVADFGAESSRGVVRDDPEDSPGSAEAIGVLESIGGEGWEHLELTWDQTVEVLSYMDGLLDRDDAPLVDDMPDVGLLKELATLLEKAL